jgi:hypothetical protein
MNRCTKLVLMGVIPLSVAITLPQAAALAQQKQQFSFKVSAENSKFTQQQNVDIGDMPNHFVRVFEVRRAFPNNPPLVNGLKLVEEFDRGVADLADGNGTNSGYSVFVMDNGDKFFARSSGTIWTVGGKFIGTTLGRITEGTGKLAGIQGVVHTVTNFDPKSGLNEQQGEVEYSLGK